MASNTDTVSSTSVEHNGAREIWRLSGAKRHREQRITNFNKVLRMDDHSLSPIVT
jgi:hypothetical protein